jgi:hypothetical protein
MQSVIDVLSLGWLSTLVGVVGIVLAVVFYLRSKRKTSLAFQHDHVTLVGRRGAAFPAEVEIRFSGVSVPRITATKVVIWNCGDRTISGSDLVAEDSLRVEVPQEARILSYSILQQTRTVNGWKIDQPSSSRLNLSFDFIDPRDGINLEVLHTAPVSRIDLKGTIKGMPTGIKDYGRPRWSPYRHRPPGSRYRRVVVAVPIVLGAGMALSVFLLPYFGIPLFSDGSSEEWLRWVMIAVGSAYAIFPTFLLWSGRRRYPSALELVHEDEGASKDAIKAEFVRSEDT